MTEIIPYLHQVGAHELNELVNADLVIDMGGVLSLAYAGFIAQGEQQREAFKRSCSMPILSFEIDELGNVPFYDYKAKMPHIRRIVTVGSSFVKNALNVYTLCLAGQNRSGFMSTLILMDFGYPAVEAIQIVRNKRADALNNDLLREFILTL